MNVAFREPDKLDTCARRDRRGAAAAVGHRRRLCAHALFEDVVDGLSALISRHREPGTEVLRFPPVMSRRAAGEVRLPEELPASSRLRVLPPRRAKPRSARAVDRFEAGEDWTPALSPADLVLSPAACYPVYPLAASRGARAGRGLLFDVACDCFRREPSKDLDRLQSFRMREYVLHRHARADRRFPRALDDARAGDRRPAGPALAHRSGQRSVLRPRRQAHGGEPGRAGAEIRAARCRCARPRSRPPA